jgi:hypothetical protein
MRPILSLVAGLAAAASVALPAAAQDNGERSLSLELNAVSQVDTACRFTFLAHNQMGVEISELAVEVVLFDKDAHFMSILALKTGRLTDDKSRVRQFLLPNVACDDVSSVLVNDVTECTGQGLTAPACLDALKVSSKAAIALDL